MKSTFFAILASAAVVLASPLPEADADFQGMPPAYGPAQGGYQPPQGQWPPGGQFPPQGQFPPGGNFPPAAYPPVDPHAYSPPQGGPPPQGGVVGGFQGQFSGTFGGQWLAQGIPPPPQFGLQQWPAPGGFPQGSPFNDGGIDSFGATCSNTQQAVSCCTGGNSAGLLGGLLPGSCTLDLLSPQCQQNVACCDTQEQNGLINIGLQCSSLI